MTLGSAFLAHAPGACRRLLALPVEGALARAEASIATVPFHDDAAVAAWVVAEPFTAAIALAALADRPHTLFGERIAAVLPELAGLVVPTKRTTHEHAPPVDGAHPTPLLDHVLRAVTHALTDTPRDPTDRAVLTTVLLFADVAKGGDATMRESWRTRLGVSGTVHNEDSALVLADVFDRVLGRAAPFRDDSRAILRTRVLCQATGLTGMRLRGEIGRDAFARLRDFLRSEPYGGARTRALWAAIDRCDTSAVRDGLWTSALAAAFDAERASLADEAAAPDEPGLAERLVRLRTGALFEQRDVDAASRALAQLGGARALLESRMAACSIWYGEASLGALSLEGAVRLLAHLAGVAATMLDTAGAWHLDLLGVVPALRDDTGAPRTYPVRLLEALLARTDASALSEGKLAHGARGEGAEGRALVAFPATKGGERAIVVRLEEGEEARALLSLLAIYERKGAAEFHATLKALCDLYELRKDDFDRVANEASYLRTMNAARSDKARMVDFVRPGLVVEVGPGGGVVLDLLAAQVTEGRIVGLDASQAVVESLARRKVAEGSRWEIVHGDAFELSSLFPGRSVTSVVFCSVLHEIFSYVPWPPGEGGKRFSLDAVDAIVRAAFASLAPGGRIVVRDGVMPPEEPRVIELLSDAWREGFKLFASRYEARSIPFEPLEGGRIRLSLRDLYEVVTTLTWGPDAFPYEIREQRAVLPRDAYVERLCAACEGVDPPYRAVPVPVPPDLASYLQPGYTAGIAGHVRIFDGAGTREVGLPDITGVWVLEKT